MGLSRTFFFPQGVDIIKKRRRKWIEKAAIISFIVLNIKYYLRNIRVLRKIGRKKSETELFDKLILLS